MYPEPSKYTLFALPDIPLIREGDNIAVELLRAVERTGLEMAQGDILVIAQKIVSKAEGREILLSEVLPSPEARALAEETGKDPRIVELILQESVEIVRKSSGTIISRTRLGFVQAHAGIDQSNVDHSEGERALLLPVDPDASADRIRDHILAQTNIHVGVVIMDSMNRPWRLGTVGAALGCAGITVLDDRCGHEDLYGRRMRVKMIHRADNLASAANLLMGETSEGIPAVLIRGLPVESGTQNARDAIRPLAQDLFR